MKVFYELYDALVGDTISYHATIQGAMSALSKHTQGLGEPLARDWGVGLDSKGNLINISLKYTIQAHELEE